MPVRTLNRQQAWLLPPTLEELIPDDHPARFVAAFVDSLDRSAWMELGVVLDGEPLGAPEYHPRGLLSVWLYGFMTGTRSTRKLEAACRDTMPYLWLTGWQHPDHNTLWRFYEEHRKSMRHLFKRTVRLAVKMGLIDLAVQAVDGSKIAANASKSRTHNVAELKQILERTEEAIRDLEAQNTKGEGPAPVHLPAELTRKQELCQKVKEAIEQLETEDGREETNLTDEDASFMKSRHGIIAGYNAQVMVCPVKNEETKEKGFIITAADVVTDPDDHAQLAPMMEQAEEMTGAKASMTLADGGYHCGANLLECANRGQVVAMPEAQRRALEKPYHKDRFVYNQEKDSYTCPHGHVLNFAGEKQRSRAELPVRIYRGEAAVCRNCPAFGTCTSDKRQGRALEIGPHEDALRAHRTWMATEEAKAAYKQRKELPEPVFGILKEQRGARRFLLRGLDNVRAEWLTLGTAFNLRTLWRFWREGTVFWTKRQTQSAPTAPHQLAHARPSRVQSVPHHHHPVWARAA